MAHLTAPTTGVTLSSLCQGDWTFKPQVIRRLHRMVSSYDRPLGRYNIANPPFTGTDWIHINGAPDSQYLAKNGLPVRFWVVGEVYPHGAVLVDEHGNSPPVVQMRIRPVRNGECDLWKAFLNRLGGCSLGFEDDTYGPSILATKTTTTWVNGVPTVTPFTQCYNALAAFHSHAAMLHWPCGNVREADVVLTEVRVLRSVANNGSIPTEFYVHLVLDAVSVLHKAPDYVDVLSVD